MAVSYVSFDFQLQQTPMTPAIKLLDKLKIPYQVMEYQSSEDARNYGEAAANALQQDTAQVFKTLISIVDGNHRKPVVALVAVADQLDLKKLASEMKGRKAVMADSVQAQKSTGYVVGGISPLGQRQRLPTLIDSTASTFETIFISGGKRGIELEIDPKDLITVLQARFAEISKPK